MTVAGEDDPPSSASLAFALSARGMELRRAWAGRRNKK